MASRVEKICLAYELGFQDGLESDLKPVYAAGTDEAEAYQLGFDLGLNSEVRRVLDCTNN